MEEVRDEFIELSAVNEDAKEDESVVADVVVPVIVLLDVSEVISFPTTAAEPLLVLPAVAVVGKDACDVNVPR